jgi:TPR repeat protein
LYRTFAEERNASAQHKMGWMHHEGKSVPQDNTTVVKWYKLTAEQGDATVLQKN